MKQQGKVKWFNATKGFGFIESEEHGDVFVHHSNIEMDGYRTLSTGQTVSFTVANTDKGVAAKDVEVID